jgi:hypothetical protein
VQALRGGRGPPVTDGGLRSDAGAVVLGANVIPATVPLRSGGPAGEGSERPGRVPGPGQGKDDLPGGLAIGRVGEAAGDLDGGLSVARWCRQAERLEPVARVADDVPCCDLPGGGARLRRPTGQGSGEFGDPLDCRGLIGGPRRLAAVVQSILDVLGGTGTGVPSSQPGDRRVQSAARTTAGDR